MKFHPYARRYCLKWGMSALTPVLLPGIVGRIRRGALLKWNTGPQPQYLDNGRAFMCNPAIYTSVRVWIKNQTIIVDEQSGKEVVYYQGGSCRIESRFGEKDLFSENDGETWSQPVVIATATDTSKTKTLSYPRVFEANPGEIWITTTYAGFAGYLSVRLHEKDFN
ncbi:hypothetical protein KUV50_02235 [Membranicola marinus]|uniref:BNR repeat-like domain-containing protein n=1 Tax=Membranihabitans marinus TaxID=1227546 RepID=A0A953L9S3_9BACT|nr:hypothetical protein [Membranihabitans marinus]MBY5956936.1 hypothetical protein [Membranihabitans marinus]